MTQELIPLVVAIINYNGAEHSIECLRSLDESSFRSFRPLLIDNASRDGSVDKIRRASPQVEILQLPRNAGYSGGCNAAIRSALSRSASYCLVLNNDTVVDRHALGYLIETAGNHERLAAVGPRIMDYTKRDVILSLGGEVNLRTGWGRHEGHGEIDRGTSNRLRDVKGFLDGSAMMFVLANLQSIGPFDERYFMYHEESDWCYRARRAGFRLLLDGRAIVRHKGRGTARLTDPRVQYLSHRNRVLFLRKFASRRQWLEFWLGLPLEVRSEFRPSLGDPQLSGPNVGTPWPIVRGLIDGLCGGDKFRNQYTFD